MILSRFRASETHFWVREEFWRSNFFSQLKTSTRPRLKKEIFSKKNWSIKFRAALHSSFISRLKCIWKETLWVIYFTSIVLSARALPLQRLHGGSQEKLLFPNFVQPCVFPSSSFGAYKTGNQIQQQRKKTRKNDEAIAST